MAGRASDVDEPLGRYRAMRDFSATDEPRGGSAAGSEGARRYVVQRHRATRLHYDFRLELDGVLVSWAVPKGPTLDADARRLAVHVEDHPVEYADFEGVIGEGEYGGGDVIVWDRGTWRPADDDPTAALAKGSLHFDLDGERLAGRFVLARRGEQRGKEQWIMIHKHDDAARAGWDAEDHPTSVVSGRTNDEVRAAAVPDARPAADGGPHGRWTKAELYAEARRRDLPGRSKLSRAELAEALRVDDGD